MLYWFDTEFIEDGKTIDLISIGIVAEDGRTFYAESMECNYSRASAWVQANVFPHLSCYPDLRQLMVGLPVLNPKGEFTMLRRDIREGILALVGDDPKPQFWAYYGAYDWVALCQLFGTMMDLPKGWPKYCRDLKQLAGNSQLPARGGGEHHALADAIWTKHAWQAIWRPVPSTTFPAVVAVPRFPGIEKAALAISYDNGLVRWDRSEAKVKRELAAFISRQGAFNSAELEDIEVWLSSISEDQLNTVCAGEATEADKLLAGAPAKTGDLLNAIFENVY